MTVQTPVADVEIFYPESDGQPMADNTKQFRWIVTIKEGLEALFADVPDVFVAGDLLWYPVEGQPDIRAAPDVLVAFGRPKGDRGSYLQWQEENIAPQVVFEILSPNDTVPSLVASSQSRTIRPKLTYWVRGAKPAPCSSPKCRSATSC